MSIPFGIMNNTRNTFCGTWYLPHSHVHINERTVPYGRMHGAWTRGLYFHFRSKIWRHHRVPRPRFPLDAGISAIRP